MFCDIYQKQLAKLDDVLDESSGEATTKNKSVKIREY